MYTHVRKYPSMHVKIRKKLEEAVLSFYHVVPRD